MKRTNGRHGQSGKEQRFSGWNMLESILFLSVIANRCWNPIIDTPCLSRLIRDLINCTFWSPPFLRGSLVAQADGSCTSDDCEVSLRQLRAEKLKAIEKEAHVLGVGAFPLFGHKTVFGLAFSWWTTGIYVWYYDFWYTVYRIFMIIHACVYNTFMNYSWIHMMRECIYLRCMDAQPWHPARLHPQNCWKSLWRQDESGLGQVGARYD